MACLDRGPILQGEALSKKEGSPPRISNSSSGGFNDLPGMSKISFNGLGEYGEEEEGFEGTEAVPDPVGSSEVTI
ncbi:hypothetical protein O181_032479 [Austropuccinia psidii MF-1]|uniref:Uncharacterized protein n=1 Tax=Austropuccinia psidii MF-1 TaxID=1389203 RepID=A0A9Q3CWW0_9BASI|nr:hypothetical protein [Austropuccinia psidii MF-1]